MEDNERLRTLHSYEAKEPRSEGFGGWFAGKRQISLKELLQGRWIKIGNHGHSYLMNFLSDGRFTEFHLFTNERHEGHWEFSKYINTMLLNLSVQTTEEGEVCSYELTILGAIHDNIHSGIETRNGVLNAYFKVIHLV